MKPAVLKAEQVCKSTSAITPPEYRDDILKNVDLELHPGKIYGLLGRHGAGKTTLLHVLTARSAMDSGSVTYGGQPVRENADVLQNICFSLKFAPEFPDKKNTLKAKFYLTAAALFYKNWDQAYADRLMEEFRLDPKQKICSMSSGQISMLSTLIAMASRAPLTLLDEPVSGLDLVARTRFYQLLLEDYTETNRTFVIATHIIEEASPIFERVIIMDKGRILEDADTAELVDRFRCISGLADTVDQVTGGLEVLSTRQEGRRKTAVVRGIPEQPDALLCADVDVAPMSLQDVFVTLCGHGD